jgi:DNA-binding protein HU-beta
MRCNAKNTVFAGFLDVKNVKNAQKWGFLNQFTLYMPAFPYDSRTRKALMAKKPVAKKAAAKVARTTISTNQLAAAIAEQTGMSKKESVAYLDTMFGMITKHLKKGDRIRLSGIGIMEVRKRPARMGRNPATGEAIKIKASKKVAFRAAKELKESV